MGETRTYVTCFPANKNVFSIRIRFAGGLSLFSLQLSLPEGGVDTATWKLAQSASRRLSSMSERDDRGKKNTPLFLLGGVCFRPCWCVQVVVPFVLFVGAIRVVLCKGEA